MRESKFTLVDQRKPPTTDGDDVGIGAVVMYVTTAGDKRRGVVVRKTDATTTILDGVNEVQLRGARRTAIVKLAPSTEAYAQRAALEAKNLSSARGWCSVGTETIRNVNTTGIVQDPVLVVVRAAQVYSLKPTGLTLRRSDFARALEGAFEPNELCYWSSRDFVAEHPTTGAGTRRRAIRKFGLELVDALPTEL